MPQSFTTSSLSTISRRQFLGSAGSVALGILAFGCVSKKPKNSEFLFFEAEGFDNRGGWEIDQQSMDVMGSPYLLAHGLGVPVKDAATQVVFPSCGDYRLWVRTRDWVAPWKAPGCPGKFQVLVDGKAVEEVFGTKNAEWHWHDGGVISVKKKNVVISLHDLTGFEGRCEALLFCKDTDFVPSNDVNALAKFRRTLLGLPDKPEEGGEYDFIVTGGGLAGTCAALAAARRGLKVALIQDRPVLGGNGSFEVRVRPAGSTQVEPHRHVGDIVEEICQTQFIPSDQEGRKWISPYSPLNFNDEHMLNVVRNDPNISLFLNHRVNDVEVINNTIKSVVAESIESGERLRLRANFFADCTGDANVGYLAGADFEYEIGQNMGMTNVWQPMDASEEKHVLSCDCKDKDALLTQFREGKHDQPFPRCPWAIDLSDKVFPGRKNKEAQWGGNHHFGGDHPLGFLGTWFWESGFDKDIVRDVELIRDNNFRAMYGAWDTLKNVDGLYPNHRLEWAAFIAGKRESRRLMGDVVLDADDFRTRRQWEDGVFPASWHIDIHSPHPEFSTDDLNGEAFISQATDGEHFKYGKSYWAPYRSLYSRNINNLFMAGRNISVTKAGLGPVRVMRTCGMMGEAVGKAASICMKKKTTPRGVYQNYLQLLLAMLDEPGDKSFL